jgi:hypothetical protein
MDIDTLTLVSLYEEQYYHSEFISWRVVAESCREEPMYRST